MAFIAILALSTTPLRAQSDDMGEQTITELASQTSELSTLVAALQAADLASTLEGEGPFTVFAPTNDAFRALPQEVFNALLKAENRDALVSILKYHVADGKLAAADVMAAIDGAGDEGFTATTMGGDFTASTMDGGVRLTDGQGNEAMVSQTDIMASNGVIHLIDHVLLPADLDVAALTTEDMAEMEGDMNDEMNDDMMDDMSDEMKEEGQEMGNAMENAGEETAQGVKRTAQEVGNAVSETASTVGEAVGNAAEATYDEVTETAREMTDGDDMDMDTDMNTTRTAPGTTAYGKGNTIVDVASKNGDFKTLVTAIEAAELSDLLGSDTEFTVFAPNDEAFNKLPEGTVSDLTQTSNKEKLQGILSYHVVASKVSAADLVKAIQANKGYFRIQTISGESLIASMEGDNVILTDGNGGKSTVTATDVMADNGIIHVLDTVLMPKTAM